MIDTDSTIPAPLTLAEFFSVMDDVVSERGEGYTYATSGGSCFYKPHPGYADNRARSGCLIGEILARTGHLDAYPDSYLHDMESSHGIGLVATDIGLFDDRRTAVIATAAQYAQDHGYPWGVARDVAREYARRTEGLVLPYSHYEYSQVKFRDVIADVTGPDFGTTRQ